MVSLCSITLSVKSALMSAKAYRDKKALPLVEKLKEVVKNLTIKCVQLTEQGKKLTAAVKTGHPRCCGVSMGALRFVICKFTRKTCQMQAG